MTVPVQAQCWEQCFRNVATENNLDVLQEIYKTGNAIKRVKNIHSANGIVYLLDSTFARPCYSSSSSSSSSSSESFELRHTTENATSLWKLELQLMAIFASMSGSTRTFPVRYNENAAWSCNEYSCLDCCQTIQMVKASTTSAAFNTNATACIDGLLEPACRLGYRGLKTYTCTPGWNNTLAVAIMNSNAHSHVHKRGEYADYSPCHTFFHYRYALGLHNAKLEDMKRFESDDDYHNYISDGPLMRNVTQTLFDCINTSCCPTPPTLPPPTKCWAAYGHTGEKITSIGATNGINRHS